MISTGSRRPAALIGLLGVTVLLSTCPAPFKLSDLDILEDRQGPRLVLDEPVDGAMFQDVLTLTGTTVDLDAKGLVRPLDDRAAIPTLGWSIAGKEDSGAIAVQPDGSFTLDIHTEGYTGNISLILTAVDLNKNQSSLTRRLLYDSSGPVVTVDTPIDRSVIGKTVVVEGSIRNSDGSPPTNVAAVAYEVLNTLITGDLSESFDPETGDFSFEFDTTNLSGNILVRITATDRQGDSTSIIRQLTSDLVGPAIFIVSPADYSIFTSSIAIAGSVANSDDDDAVDEVVSLVYSTMNSLQSTAVPFDSTDGSFSFNLDATGIKADIVVTLVAVDIHGHASSRTLTLRNDGIGPYLSLTSPVDGYYSTCIQLSGRVQNGQADAGLGEVDLSSVSYRIPGTIVSGSLVVGEEAEGNNFQAEIDASQLATTIVLELTASDKNGNESIIQVNLLKPAGGGSINARAVVQNGSISFSWDPVPGATGYRIEEFVFGGIRDNIQLAPDGTYTWTGLRNGTFHEFQLSATVPGYETAVSSDLVLAPMSPLTFRPWAVNSGYGSIILEWAPSLTTGARYLLERRVNGGTWEALTVTTASRYTDTDVIKSNYYRYRLTLRNNGSSGLNQGTESMAIKPAYFTNQPVVIKNLSSYTFHTIEKNEDTLILSDTSQGLHFFNLQDPLSPELETSITFFGERFYKAGGFTYGFTSGDQSIKVANLETNSMAGTFQLPVSVETMSVYSMSHYGNTLYVGVVDTAYPDPGIGAVYIYDISSPASPVYIEYFACDPMGLMAYGDHVFISNRPGTGGAELLVADTGSETIEPVATGLFHANSNSGIVHLAINGQYLFIRDNSTGMRAYNITNPAAPLEVANGGSSIYSDGDIFIDGSTMYIADAYRGGYKAFDLGTILNGNEDADGTLTNTDPYLYTMELDGYTADIYAENGVLWLAQLYNGGICIVDIDIPSSISETGSFSLSGGDGDTNFIQSSINRMFVLSGSFHSTLAGRLHIVDFADPEIPVETGKLDVESPYTSWPDLAIAGDTIVLPSMKTIDITNPSPVPTYSGVSTKDRPVKIRLRGDLAVVGTTVNDGISLFDVSDLTSPTQLSTLLEGGSIAVELSGNYVVSAESDTLVLVDPGNRNAPLLTSTISSTTAISDLAVRDNLIFVLDGSDMRVFEVNHLTGSLTEQSSYTYALGLDFDHHEILVQGDFILIRSENSTDTRLTLLDASDITSISETASLTLAGLDTDCMEWSAEYIYLGDNESRKVVVCTIE